MKHLIPALFAVSALVAGPLAAPAAAQQDARAILQAADRAIGADRVNSVQYTATGRIAFLGQNYTVNDDLPRVDLQSYTQTIDYPSKSAREEYVRVQGNNPNRGGGAGFPIQGTLPAKNYVNGNYAWTVNAQGQPQAQPADAEARQFLIWVSPHGFIKAALASGNATESERHF